ncbi:MAG: winged helix DNA-binding protein [Nanoarchaeota archaeon]|nr:winged helix DNA-binding protein [Nanoarchaeota archaeon]
MKKIICLTIFVMIMLSCTAYADGSFLHITMDLETGGVEVNSSYNIETFNSADYINKLDEGYIFTFSYESEYSFDDFILKIALPKESIINEKQNVLMLSRPAKISTDGQQIYVEWANKLSSGEEFTAFVEYKAKTSQINYLIIGVVLILISFIIGYKIKSPKKEKILKTFMSPDEKAVMNIIKRDKDVIQNDIKRELNWSKSKMSKILRNLEIKDLIDKKPYKKTNRIKLK